MRKGCGQRVTRGEGGGRDNQNTDRHTQIIKRMQTINNGNGNGNENKRVKQTANMLIQKKRRLKITN